MLFKNEIFNEVQQIFVDMSDLVHDDVSLDCDLELDLDLFELERIELAVCLEERFKIDISDNEVFEFDTVQDIVDLVAIKLGVKE